MVPCCSASGYLKFHQKGLSYHIQLASVVLLYQDEHQGFNIYAWLFLLVKYLNSYIQSPFRGSYTSYIFHFEALEQSSRSLQLKTNSCQKGGKCPVYTRNHLLHLTSPCLIYVLLLTWVWLSGHFSGDTPFSFPLGLPFCISTGIKTRYGAAPWTY